MLAVVAVISLWATPAGPGGGWLALVGAAALPAILAPEHRLIGPLARLAEVVTTCLAAAAVAHMQARSGAAAGTAATVLPYLTVPVVSATLSRRRVEVPVQFTVAVVLLAAAPIVDADLRHLAYSLGAVQGLLLTGVAAAVAGTLQHSLLPQRDSPQPYAEATRLLTQLRSVARQLPGATLDPG